MLSAIKNRMFQPISPLSLGVVRIIFGIVLLIQFFLLEEYICDYLTQSDFYLTYDFFHWIKIMSPDEMHYLFNIAKVLSVLFILGILFRISTIALFFIFTYVFLLDAGHYNNHYYLISLFLFLFSFMKANSALSVRNIFKKENNPIPFWNVGIIRFQMVVVYLFGAIAKLNTDWLTGYPMRFWLRRQTDIPWLDSFMTSELGVYFFSYAGLIFDLLIGFLLLNSRTRKWALIPLLIFHISNHFLWNIGVFPWFSIGITIIFFKPDLSDLGFKPFNNKILTPLNQNKTIVFILSLYVLLQTTFPFRQHITRETSTWDGVGYKFAWRMMLADKTNLIKVKVKVPEKNEEFYLALDKYFTARQFRRLNRQPKNAWRFAHHINEKLQSASNQKFEIYLYSLKSINGREFQHLYDTSINILQYPYSQLSLKAPNLNTYNPEISFRDDVDIISEEELSSKLK